MPRPDGRRRVASTRSTACSPARSIAGLARLGVEAAIARHDGARAGRCASPSQQGADLRVGDRKLCGSAQVRRGGAVLQHGSILLDRLPVRRDRPARRPAAATPGDPGPTLRAATVTLEELGAPTDPRVVADALVEGFRDDPRPRASTSTVDLDARASSVASSARRG